MGKELEKEHRKECGEELHGREGKADRALSFHVDLLKDVVNENEGNSKMGQGSAKEGEEGEGGVLAEGEEEAPRTGCVSECIVGKDTEKVGDYW